jgi:hypothetical protein
MKKGIQFDEFLAIAKHAETLKRDYEVHTDRLRAVPGGPSGIGLNLGRGDTYRLSAVAHDQLATLTGIPRNYYGKMLQTHPSTLASLVNTHLVEDELPRERFVRTIGGKVRALLSTRYGVLDHIDVANMLNDCLIGQGGMEVRSVVCTERRLTFQLLMPRHQGEVAVGDVVQAGLAISNSEVGLGRYSVEALLYRLVCTNGLIAPSRNGWRLERIHLGQIKMDDILEYTQERVLALPRQFDHIIEMSRRADGVYVPEEKLPVVVDRVRREQALTQEEADSVLEEWHEGRRCTMWGLVNALNYQAHTAEPDRSVELERISGNVLDAYY